MASFAEFLKSLDADSGKRGKQFEHFVKWFLKNDPEWTTQVDKVWQSRQCRGRSPTPRVSVASARPTATSWAVVVPLAGGGRHGADGSRCAVRRFNLAVRRSCVFARFPLTLERLFMAPSWCQGSHRSRRSTGLKVLCSRAYNEAVTPPTPPAAPSLPSDRACRTPQ
jgi:hypothetical protein